MKPILDPQQQHDLIDKITQYGIIVATFIFAMVAKIHVILKYRKRMTKLQCFVETTLTGIGSSIAIYALTKMNLQTWLFCFLGGFSGLVISPIANTISEQINPVLDLIVQRLKQWIKTYKK